MTLPPAPNDKLGDAPFSDLMRVLLSQFKRLLADNGTTLTADETLEVARAISDGESHPKLPAIQTIMQTLVDESLTLIQDRWKLTFLQSLYASMDDLDNWETTAEFLEIANEKSNAELRVSAGSSLLVAMGNLHFAPYLLDVIKHDNGVMDVDAVFAKRVLLHVSSTEDNDTWYENVTNWLDQQ